jgi:thiosulfate/3-mercaptopyruvate sulfurtransferase
MAFRTLIGAAELQTRILTGTPLVLLDCGFDLADPSAGRRAFASGHLPGACYAHLDTDLSGHKTGHNGRHPLPDFSTWAATVGSWGITPQTQVVTYDDQGGPYAARAWWMLRWLGHGSVAVLNGGRAAWLAAGGTLSTDVQPAQPSGPYPAAAPAMPTVDAAALQARLGQGRLFDARAGERFRGEVEPLDKVAGHIPGATLRFFKDNLQADGLFKPPGTLRREFDALGASGLPSASLVHQCGSGVTACHNLMAMAHAGFGDTVLYPGSWSEWCSDTQRPMVKGSGA